MGPIGMIEKAADLTMRDWFATFAPEPPKETIQYEMEQDRLNNPHGDGYKSKRRSELEIRTQLRYVWANEMMEARKVPV